MISSGISRLNFMWHFETLRIYTVAGKCTVDSKDNEEDNNREEADMTLSPFFSKSVQSGPKVIQKMGNSQKHLKYGFGPLQDT